LPIPGGGRYERRQHYELLADTSGGRPASERHTPAGARCAGELTSDCFMVRREHHAAGRKHRVEACVVVFHLLRVARFEADVETERRGELPRTIDEHRREIHARDRRSPFSSEESDPTRPTGRVEELDARAGVESLDDEVVDISDRREDPLVRAAAPHNALSCFQLCESHRRPRSIRSTA